MTGLRVWLHPSSRTRESVLGSRLPVLSWWFTENWELRTGFLHPSAFRRTAAVMRNGRGILDVAHFDAGGGQGADGGLASGTGATDAHFYRAYAVVARHVGGVGGGLLSGKGRAFARSAETE